jgi:hypothetical protein
VTAAGNYYLPQNPATRTLNRWDILSAEAVGILPAGAAAVAETEAAENHPDVAQEILSAAEQVHQRPQTLAETAGFAAEIGKFVAGTVDSAGTAEE